MGLFSRKEKINVDDIGHRLSTLYIKYIDELDSLEGSPNINNFIDSVPEGSINVFRVMGEFRILFCFEILMALRDMASNEQNRILVPEFMLTIKPLVEEFLQENETLSSIIDDYFEEWDKAIIRSKKIFDNSTLNNPLYCISKKASNRCMNDGKDSLIGIIFFTDSIKTIHAGLHEAIKQWKIV